MAQDLDDVLRSLQTQLSDRPLSLGPLCTRVLLRTGVNLKSVRPEQRGDPALLRSVCSTLSEMGYAA